MKRLENLRNRRIPLDEARLRTFAKAAEVDNESYEWLIEATKPIEEKYTNETFAQGDRVRDQLKNNLSITHDSEFEYQGSVTSDTHVQYHSDIDLLVLNGVYTTYDGGYPVSNPVSNEVVVDSLLDLRKDSVKILKTQFWKATVDESGNKAVAISGGSLTRDIDVVFCNWWDTKAYLENKVRANRGIQVLDVDSTTRIGNKPFLHNWYINDKDTRVGGGLRKVIRLLKNLKYDKEPNASISSYDIAALGFEMQDSDLIVAPGSYLALAKNASAYLNGLINNSQLRDSLYVPNGTRKIFGTDGASLASLKEITSELDLLLADIPRDLSNIISFSEARGNFTKSASWTEARASRVREVTDRIRAQDV
ncbi:MAG TPA: hypothetical protein VGO11_12915 [Chthoniobacteraceae bacterium]|jgi:hypothetical protein|nr:hypothetical protein [Chthoniobacteraceae bacterium]